MSVLINPFPGGLWNSTFREISRFCPKYAQKYIYMTLSQSLTVNVSCYFLAASSSASKDDEKEMSDKEVKEEKMEKGEGLAETKMKVKRWEDQGIKAWESPE